MEARGAEPVSKMPDASGAATGPSSAELFKLILTTQKQQMSTEAAGRVAEPAKGITERAV